MDTNYNGYKITIMYRFTKGLNNEFIGLILKSRFDVSNFYSNFVVKYYNQ